MLNLETYRIIFIYTVTLQNGDVIVLQVSCDSQSKQAKRYHSSLSKYAQAHCQVQLLHEAWTAR